ADGDGRYSLEAAQLARDLGGSRDRLRSLVGHLTRAGVLKPLPAAPDRVEGRMVGAFDRRAGLRCRASLEEAARARWRQYREVWAYVERDACRRVAILRHFGDGSEPERRPGACCDACDPGLAVEPPAPEPAALESLDEAIVSVAR